MINNTLSSYALGFGGYEVWFNSLMHHQTLGSMACSGIYTFYLNKSQFILEIYDKVGLEFSLNQLANENQVGISVI